MSTNLQETAARRLADARRERRHIDRLPESCRPTNNDEALAIQPRIVGLLGDRTGGWKCALPRGENLFLAPLPASAIHAKSPCPILLQDGVARIEPEIAFVLGSDLPPRKTTYTQAEVSEAISETRLVLELIGSRYSRPKDLPFVEFLADCINNQGLFIGPVLNNALEQQLETLRIGINSPSSTIAVLDGGHPNGHPLRPLVWLANFLSGRGEALNAGQIITTGSYAGILEVPLATPLTVVFGDLGELSVTFNSVS